MISDAAATTIQVIGLARISCISNYIRPLYSTDQILPDHCQV
jgi:hypothetical protein